MQALGADIGLPIPALGRHVASQVRRTGDITAYGVSGRAAVNVDRRGASSNFSKPAKAKRICGAAIQVLTDPGDAEDAGAVAVVTIEGLSNVAGPAELVAPAFNSKEQGTAVTFDVKTNEIAYYALDIPAGATPQVFAQIDGSATERTNDNFRVVVQLLFDDVEAGSGAPPGGGANGGGVQPGGWGRAPGPVARVTIGSGACVLWRRTANITAVNTSTGLTTDKDGGTPGYANPNTEKLKNLTGCWMMATYEFDTEPENGWCVVGAIESPSEALGDVEWMLPGLAFVAGGGTITDAKLFEVPSIFTALDLPAGSTPAVSGTVIGTAALGTNDVVRVHASLAFGT